MSERPFAILLQCSSRTLMLPALISKPFSPDIFRKQNSDGSPLSPHWCLEEISTGNVCDEIQSWRSPRGICLVVRSRVGWAFNWNFHVWLLTVVQNWQRTPHCSRWSGPSEVKLSWQFHWLKDYWNHLRKGRDWCGLWLSYNDQRCRWSHHMLKVGKWELETYRTNLKRPEILL